MTITDFVTTYVLMRSDSPRDFGAIQIIYLLTYLMFTSFTETITNYATRQNL